MSTPKNSILQYAENINPKSGNDKKKWFLWPPDIFALTSIILEKSGWYRIVIKNYDEGPLSEEIKKSDCCVNDSSWLEKLELITKQWENWLEDDNTKKNSFFENMNIFWNFIGKISLEDLKLSIFDFIKNSDCDNSKQNDQETNDRVRFILIVIELHASSDQLCCNYGISRASLPRNGFREYKANTLLILHGTMSNISTVYGIVLPKLRVPKVGLSLRSMSHNICFIKTEVEVIWRNFNWMNIDQDSLNILVVPIPSEIPTNYFTPSKEAIRDSYDSASYFDYKPEKKVNEYQNIDFYILNLINKAIENSSRVHILVFPELSLSFEELECIKRALFNELEYNQIPLIVAGLRTVHTEVESGKISIKKTNSVVLSSFFAGRWYDLIQDKHHRWRLDSSQIDNYGLSGVLHGGGGWWENTQLERRQLAFLSANGWLNLCPLICEDLARVEPVSHVIRSVGPNLLIAVLLDGPQIVSRWPARYATVFAEDPGTSVLTVTALGMCKRSNPPNIESNQHERTVALWRDDTGNFREISLDESAEAVLLTVEAKRISEHTAHGISDNMGASRLILRNVQQVRIHNDYYKKIDIKSNEDIKTNDLFSTYQTILLNNNKRHIRELSFLSLATNAYLLTPTEQIKDAFSVSITSSKNKNECFYKIFKELSTELTPEVLFFSCRLLIQTFNYVEDERKAFFKEYKLIKPIENEDAIKDIRDHRETKFNYLNKLSEICIRNIFITEDKKNGLSRSFKKIREITKKEVNLKRQLNEMTAIRFFQAVNLSIIWSIHNYLSETEVRKINSKKEHYLMKRLEDVCDIKTKPYHISEFNEF